MTWRRLVTAILLLTGVGGLLVESPFAQIPALFRLNRKIGYENGRVLLSFQGRRFDQTEHELDLRLPRSLGVSLAPPLAMNDFLRQRLAETLYPRLIDQRSPYLLTWRERASRAELAIELPPNLKPAPPSVVNGSILPVLLRGLLLAALGAALGGLFRRSGGLAEAMLRATFLVATVTTAGAVFQVAVPPFALPFAGALALGAIVLRLYREKSWRLPEWGTPEAIAFTALVLVLAACLLAMPISDWDARSIWFFRAKELFYQGYFSRADAVREEYFWNHSNYPLLLPGWIAYFSSLEPESFSERAGALGLAALFAAVAAFLWRAARARFGRSLGAAAAIALVAGAFPFVARCTADGPLVLLLGASWLAFGEERPFAWDLVWMTALVKWEGLVYALVLALPNGLRSLRLWAGFLPSLIFLAWTRSLSLPSGYEAIPWATVLGSLGARTGTLLGSLPGVISTSSLLIGGAVALVLTVFRSIFTGRWRSWPLAYCGFALSFAFFALLLTHYDLRWQIDTALDRLLAPAAVFALLGLAESARS